MEPEWIKLSITIKQFDKGRNLDQLLSWLETGLRVFTDDNYEIEENGNRVEESKI